MGDVISKISSYNIFTNLIPGAVFAFMMQQLDIYDFQSPSAVMDIIMYYFLGVIIGRIGSIVLQPMLKKIHFTKKEDYEQFISAEAKDHKISVLLEASNLYRSLCSALLMVLLSYGVKLLSTHYNLSLRAVELGTVVFLIVLFLLSYKKQTTFIEKRVKHHNQEK